MRVDVMRCQIFAYNAEVDKRITFYFHLEERSDEPA